MHTNHQIQEVTSLCMYRTDEQRHAEIHYRYSGDHAGDVFDIILSLLVRVLFLSVLQVSEALLKFNKVARHHR
jgi:hypothetical protein